MDKLALTANEVLHSINTLSGGLATEMHENENSSLTEADMLEKIVDKLSRMVSKSIGNKHVDLLHYDKTTTGPGVGSGGGAGNGGGQGSAMDNTTKDWLRHAYSFENFRPSDNNNQSNQQGSDHKQNDGSTKQTSKKGRLPVRRSIGQNEVAVDASLLHSFQFDVLSLDEFSLCDSVLFMFERYDLMNEFNVERDVFDEFIHKVRMGYNNVNYHSYQHGCDVMQFVFQLIVLK
eukprot:CAMPEP_0114384008 /NCGR_PEP_ID=MMETSP0102-20121206/5097_1 /TAXON_ID=38822 ORGANISM="Pteridomonas danica, Strain PT" /NCGR_SAMPLE_ID=MMETSP0102 /ASSEMBLY_ACC=CAM_ASM_000212 /LENGTH=232 /DNA_ID=CAMNT_0001540215 /DNA_START=261 /DNA_END=959 /DNA_ORIENTATION=+